MVASNRQTHRSRHTVNESVPKIIINNTTQLFSKTAISILVIQTITVSECCLIKLLPYILLEKYRNILALEIARTEYILAYITRIYNQHCANYIGTLLFPIDSKSCSRCWWQLCRAFNCRILYDHYLPTVILIIIGIPSPTLFHCRLKSFLFCKSSLPQPFLFLLQDSLYGFPRLFYCYSRLPSVNHALISPILPHPVI